MAETNRIDMDKVDGFALHKHLHQKRRNGEPYINHPRTVGVLARQIAKDLGLPEGEQDICHAGGVLHDTIEDTNTDFEDIEKVAGTEVAGVVAAVSDDKRRPATQRQREYVIQLKHSQLHDQIVKLADIADNTESSFELLYQVPPPLDFLVRWHRKTVEVVVVLVRVQSAPAYAATCERLDELLRLVSTLRLAQSRKDG